MSNNNFRQPEEIQSFLDGLKPMEPFRVKFLKQNGEPRELIGTLDPTKQNVRRVDVPVMTKEGKWKSFLINRVIDIRKE